MPNDSGSVPALASFGGFLERTVSPLFLAGTAEEIVRPPAGIPVKYPRAGGTATVIEESDVLGGGTAGKLPVWTGSDTLGDSVLTQGGGTVAVGTDPGGSDLLRVGGYVRGSRMNVVTGVGVEAHLHLIQTTNDTYLYNNSSFFGLWNAATGGFWVIDQATKKMTLYGAAEVTGPLTTVPHGGGTPITRSIITGFTAAFGVFRAGPALLSLDSGDLSLYAAGNTGAAGHGVQIAYYSATLAWQTALRVENVASGRSTLNLMPDGGTIFSGANLYAWDFYYSDTSTRMARIYSGTVLPSATGYQEGDIFFRTL